MHASTIYPVEATYVLIAQVELSRNNSTTFSRTVHTLQRNGISAAASQHCKTTKPAHDPPSRVCRVVHSIFHKTIRQNPRKLQNRDQTNVASAADPIPSARLLEPRRVSRKLPAKNLVSNICVTVWPLFAPRSIADENSVRRPRRPTPI